jgi:hypothetical protein
MSLNVVLTNLINANPLIRAENKVLDLGITFDRELNFHYHLDNICCKAFKMLGFIIRILMSSC